MDRQNALVVAYHQLSKHFNYFFGKLNPSTSFQGMAQSEHSTIIDLIQDRNGLAAELSPICFLQGSYRQDTAIYTINDVDIVALCSLWHPPAPGSTGKTWSRDVIFDTIAAPIKNDGRYRGKVKYGPKSMCVKVDLGIKIEILPVVYAADNYESSKEPFRLYRPETGKWEDGYARYHQYWLTDKNKKTGGNFKPAVKVFKHLRSRFGLDDVVSFHIECLLWNEADDLFRGGPADYICSLLNRLASLPANTFYGLRRQTPCGERDIFTPSEWNLLSWTRFHDGTIKWAKCASYATATTDRDQAIEIWQALFGDKFFPKEVSL